MSSSIPPATIEIRRGKHPGTRYKVGASVSIGRAPGNTIVVEDDTVSRRHAVISFEGDAFILRDAGSTNGTFVNGEMAGETKLQDGDVIYVASAILLFSCPSLKKAQEEGPSSVSFSADPRALSGPMIELDTSKARLFQLEPEESKIETLRRSHEKLQAVFRVNEIISAVMEIDVLFRQVLNLVLMTLPADRGAVLLRNPSTGSVEPKCWKKGARRHDRGGAGSVPGEAADDQPFEINRAILDRVLADKVSLLVADVLHDRRFVFEERGKAIAVRSILCAPMFHRGRVHGAIYLDTKGGEGGVSFTHEDLQVLTAVARQTAISVESAHLLVRVEEETRARVHLGRYLSKELVEQVRAGTVDLSLGGSRKRITTVFSDIRGFTAMTEGLDPADVVKILNEYYEAMIDIILQHGGMIDKFMGDTIMASWGVPVEGRNDAANAVKAALMMRDAVARHNVQRGNTGLPAVEMGTGINSGIALVGNIGSPSRMEYTAIGDTINTAARLVGLAGPGEIVLSESTYRQVGDLVAVEPMPPARLKGKKEPVQVYRLTGIQDGAAFQGEETKVFSSKQKKEKR